MSVSTTKMTARQFLQLGEDPPGVRLELVDGEVAVSPSPSPDHSYADRILSHLLVTRVEAHDLGQIFGDVDTIFGDYDVRRPDIIYFAKARLNLIGKSAMQGPPDLCVEIISPASVQIDRSDKFDQYAEGGVAHYWIVDTDKRTIEGFVLREGRYAAAGEGADDQVVQLLPFPDLAIPLKRLWRPKQSS